MQAQLTVDEVRQQTSSSVAPTLDEPAREGARRMLAAALELEAAEYVARHRGARSPDGRRLVVRNGRPSRGK